jgi:hypothetical protein
VPDITQQDLDEAEAYLREKNLGEDRWILDEGQPWLKISQLGNHLFGLNAPTIGKLAEKGEIPHAALLSSQGGWRLPRSGIIYYIAQVRRSMEQRQTG